jgi:hypothetical protein
MMRFSSMFSIAISIIILMIFSVSMIKK